MDFATGPTKKFCEICRSWIDLFEDKIQVEKLMMHKRCFVCAICDCPLEPGNCSRDDGIIYCQFMCNDRVPVWFCSAHMMLGSGEKCQLLKEKWMKENEEKQEI
ncbi:hypothetical protein niasHS_007057 [Heterodera schachtii]|uniref:LIM zinc-binding domain-containing protein n=1 Tax=Heterodera schachtii TaxID=97005 RepID=A0ABD2JFH2_HETSC